MRGIRGGKRGGKKDKLQTLDNSKQGLREVVATKRVGSESGVGR
jgi:hypothetical protein